MTPPAGGPFNPPRVARAVVEHVVPADVRESIAGERDRGRGAGRPVAAGRSAKLPVRCGTATGVGTAEVACEVMSCAGKAGDNCSMREVCSSDEQTSLQPKSYPVNHLQSQLRHLLNSAGVAGGFRRPPGQGQEPVCEQSRMMNRAVVTGGTAEDRPVRSPMNRPRLHARGQAENLDYLLYKRAARRV